MKKVIWSNAVILGLVSCFTDIGTEMIYPVLPIYLSSVLGATPTVIGIIEGIAESLASILKLFSGMIADKYNNKKQLAFIGYGSSILNKIAILFSTTWVGVLFARVIDRFGKGIRTAPRDALVAESAEDGKLGRTFGIHKMLDLLGASIGILLAFLILTLNTDNYRTLFIISIIPAMIGTFFICLVKDSGKRKEVKRIDFKWKALDKKLKLFLIIVFIFTLGNSSNSFILLRAYSAGFDEKEVILLYFVFNVVGSILSYPIGKLSDTTGRKYTLSAGYLMYGLVYLGIGLLNTKFAFWSLFALYGIYTALTAGGERALIAETGPREMKASALGLHSAIVGIGLLPASMIAGFLWNSFGEAVPFVFGGSLALLSGVAVFMVLNMKSNTTNTSMC